MANKKTDEQMSFDEWRGETKRSVASGDLLRERLLREELKYERDIEGPLREIEQLSDEHGEDRDTSITVNVQNVTPQGPNSLPVKPLPAVVRKPFEAVLVYVPKKWRPLAVIGIIAFLIFLIPKVPGLQSMVFDLIKFWLGGGLDAKVGE